ncbi:MAG: PhnD/SsuA/transferrin family substrate-binding protein [Bryobacterales bacterium]|nr:PhnD/SsuA/transferrin family substrate-binding protein [Bryobacterales bacterium]
MRIWIDQIGRTRGFQLDSKVAIAGSLEQFRHRLKEHLVDLMVLDTPEYLSLSDAGLVRAVAAGTTRGQVGAFAYLLLTGSELGGGQIAGLRGKRIAVASRTKANTGAIWLETLLAENRLGRARDFFGSFDAGFRASTCVLPLFFGKIDACVVDAGSFDALKELNPQLGRLKVAARSEVVLEGVIAMPALEHPYQRELIDSILNLHRTPAGEQFCLVFKAGPMMRVGREQYESARLLRARYRRLVDPSPDSPGFSGGRPDESAGRGLSK